MTTPPAAPDDGQHVCKPGASVFYCPTAGETESDCHGGFDVCCGRPDLHQQLVPCGLAVLKRPHNAHPWEPQPGMLAGEPTTVPGPLWGPPGYRTGDFPGATVSQ
jgi:hypothetical protein